MKIPAKFKTLIFFVSGMLLGAALFTPLDAMAEYSAATIGGTAGIKGIQLDIKESASDGIFNPKFLYSGIKIATPLLTTRIDYVEADPSILSMITSRGKNIRMSLKIGGGVIQAGAGEILTWRSATADLTIKENSMFFNNIRMDGDLKSKGNIEISDTGKIISSDLNITLPKKYDAMFEAVALIGSMPLKKDLSGGWRLRK